MNRKLKDYNVARIKQLYAKGLTQVHIAEAFRVDQSVVSDIVRGESWSAVKPASDEFQTHTLGGNSKPFTMRGSARRLIARWISCREKVQTSRASQLVFTYTEPPTYYGTQSAGKSKQDPMNSQGMRRVKQRQHAKPLPSDPLCWALTFEIILKRSLYPSERKMLAAWFKDETGETPIPSRAATKLLAECRRRGLR